MRYKDFFRGPVREGFYIDMKSGKKYYVMKNPQRRWVREDADRNVCFISHEEFVMYYCMHNPVAHSKLLEGKEREWFEEKVR